MRKFIAGFGSQICESSQEQRRHATSLKGRDEQDDPRLGMNIAGGYMNSYPDVTYHHTRRK